jgi:hypothetical protein
MRFRLAMRGNEITREGDPPMDLGTPDHATGLQRPVLLFDGG